jgi:hypothetical protein
MRIVSIIGFFGVFVVFAAALTLWRRADDWDGMPLSQRCILAVSASRKWWLAYSGGILVLFMGRYRYTLGEALPVVLVAIGLAGLLAFLRVPE